MSAGHREFDTTKSGVPPSVVLQSVEIFHSIEPIESRSTAFGASLAVHILLLVVLVLIPLLFTESIKVKYDAVALVPPVEKAAPLVETKWTRVPLPPPPPRGTPTVQPAITEPVTPPPPEPRKLDAPRLSKIEAPEPPAPPVLKPHTIAEPVPAPLAPPKMGIQTNVFSTANASSATTDVPARQVQTGGFGDPNGLPAKDSNGHPANIASLGAFDLPAASGAGNGTGGRNGVAGIVAGAGFAGATPFGARNGSGAVTASPEPKIRQSGFADVQSASPPPAAKRVDVGPPDKPVEIISKPRPDYTDEARKLRLEGEVLVRVLFASTGQVSIIELVHGLGHGLDENAVRAAQQIQFKPASRNGKPVDSTATVHIVFQLAF